MKRVLSSELDALIGKEFWEAFLDYRLNAMTLSVRDIKMIKILLSTDETFEDKFNWFEENADGSLKGNRERQEFEQKAKLLDITIPWSK